MVPDLATYGKTISGGYPLAAVCGRADIMSFADPRHKAEPGFVFVSGTTNGNPVATTAGLATLDELEKEGVYARLYEISNRLRQGLEERARDLDIPFQVIGEGPVLEPVFGRDPIRTYADALNADARARRQFSVELLRRGIFVSDQKIYLSLAHTREDVDHTLEIAAQAFETIRTELANP